MLVLFLNQGAESVLGNSVDLNLSGDHLFRLQSAIRDVFDNTSKVLLQVSQD